MSVPYLFYPNQKARSSEVNRNFQYVMQLIGTAIGEDRLQPPREFLMGARANVLLSGAADTGNPPYKYYQISWNGNWLRDVDNTWKWSRFIEGENATAIRIGSEGFEVLSTSSTSGSLNSQMKSVFKVQATTGEDRIVIGENWHIQRYDGLARDIQDYRLTYTILTQPISLYEGSSLSSGSTVFTAKDIGLPSGTKAIQISAYVTATGGTSQLWCYQERSTRNKKWGFGVVAVSSGPGAGSGVVPVGTGALAGKFVIHRTGNFSEANVFVVGYYV
jgi:hypothetical protein